MNYKKITIIILVLFVGFGNSGIWSQETVEEPFVRELVRAIARLNWDASETGEMERSLLMYEWQKYNDVDPEVIALAFSYGRDRGMENPDDFAGLAWRMAEKVQEMDRLGFSSRESARAIMNGMRASATDTDKIDAQVREQIRKQLHSAEGEMVRRRVESRTGRAGSVDSWTPPSQEERPGGGKADLPAAPNDPPGYGGQDGTGNQQDNPMGGR